MHTIWVKIGDFMPRLTLKCHGWPWKTKGHLFCTIFSISTSYNPETPNLGQNRYFLWCVTLKFDGWPCNSIGNLSYAASSFVHHFIAVGEFKLELQSGNTQFGSKSTFFYPCDLQICRMTLKNNRVPLLSNIKLCASFHRHMWIQTGVRSGNG